MLFLAVHSIPRFISSIPSHRYQYYTQLTHQPSKVLSHRDLCEIHRLSLQTNSLSTVVLEMTPGELDSLSGGSNKEFTLLFIECREHGESFTKGERERD